MQSLGAKAGGGGWAAAQHEVPAPVTEVQGNE